MRPNSLSEGLQWCGVDVGGEQVRWCRSKGSTEPLEHLEAPTLASLGPDMCFVQAAQRLRAQSPEWSCHHLMSLIDFATPSPPRSLSEAQSAVRAQSMSEALKLSGALPLSPLLSMRPGEALSLITAQGERRPTAILSELLAELLSPPRVLGEQRPDQEQRRGLVWLSSPSETPHRRAALSHILSELPTHHATCLDRSAAMALGLIEHLELKGARRARSVYHWATLDIGATQACLSIIRLDLQERRVHVLGQRGLAGVGAHALERRLIEGRLSLSGQSWASLSLSERAQRSLEASERVYWALRNAWPPHLSDARFARLSPYEQEITQRYLEELNRRVTLWLDELLIEHNLLLESLDSLWLTGSVGLALRRHTAHEHPKLRVRYSPERAALRGLESFIRHHHTGEAYTLTSPLMEELWLSSPEHPPVKLLSTQDPSPAWLDHLITASEGVSSLWLCSESSPSPTLWATLPSFSGEPRRLQVAYESPYNAHISWRSASGEALPSSEGAWSLPLPHNPHLMTPPT